jgi:hypothetical protein
MMPTNLHTPENDRTRQQNYDLVLGALTFRKKNGPLSRQRDSYTEAGAARAACGFFRASPDVVASLFDANLVLQQLGGESCRQGW